MDRFLATPFLIVLLLSAISYGSFFFFFFPYKNVSYEWAGTVV